MDSESLFSSAACAPAYMSSQYTYLAAGLCDGDGVKFPDRSSPEPNSEGSVMFLNDRWPRGVGVKMRGDTIRLGLIMQFIREST